MGSSTSRPKLLQNSVPLLPPSLPSVRSKVLPADVLLLILKLAHGTVPLRSLRVVSRLFDDLIVPIIYHHITLNPGVVDCFLQGTTWRSAAQIQVFKDIRTHTRHVSIIKELSWPLVLHLLYSLKNLLELSLSYWPKNRDDDRSIHYTVFLCPRFRARWPELRISVERYDDSMPLLFYPALANVTNVVSCKSIVPAEIPRWYQRGPIIKEALLANPQLETLHLTNNEKDIGDVGWDEQDPRKLPPFKELVLRGLLGWNFFNICDWSNITHLELINVSHLALIKDLPPRKLSGLKTFIIACGCWDRVTRQNHLPDLIGFLDNLLSCTRDLDTLTINFGVVDFHQNPNGTLVIYSEESCQQNVCLPAIAQHCQSLRSMDLRIFDRTPPLRWTWILLLVSELEAIRSSCPSLMELSLDSDMRFYDWGSRLNMDVTAALAKFRNLRRLTVYTFMDYSRPEAGLLPHHQARAVAREFVENLKRLKEGVKFERLTVKTEMERLVADDEYQGDDEEDDRWVCLDYTFEAGKAASWYVTGEERGLGSTRR